MRVLRLYIQDCGVFVKPTLIDFTHNSEAQDILCLAGVNGAGKTTVVELIFNLISLLDSDISPQHITFDRLKPNVLTRVEFAQLDILVEEKVISLVIGKSEQIERCKGLEQAFIIEPDLSSLILDVENALIKIPENEEISPTIEQLAILKAAENFSNRVKLSENIEKFKPLIEQIKSSNKTGLDKNLDLPFVYFFNAHDREIQDIRYDSIPNESPKYRLTCRYHQQRDDLKKVLIYYDYAYPKKFNELKNWINQHILIDKIIDRIDRPSFSVVIKAKNGRYHGLELLSSGEESLLIIAMQIYLKAHRNSIFIIDEIDQSLHPEFQEKIITVMKKLQTEKQCQIIITSHSEIVWSAFETKGLIDLTEMVL